MAKAINHEQFLERLSRANPNIEILSPYISYSKKVKCKCKKCQFEWDSQPNNLLTGYGCPPCGIKKRNDSQRKTTSEFIEEIAKVNPDITILEDYQGAKAPIRTKCNLCGYEWAPTPTNLLSGKSCPICSRKKSGERRRKTTEEFVQEINEKTPSISISGTYESTESTFSCTCSVCGHSWTKKAVSLQHGAGCPRCNKSERLTPESFRNKITQINPHIEVIGDYISGKGTIQCKCKICGNEWFPVANQIANKRSCPKCRHSETSFLEQVIYEVFSLALGKENVILHDQSAIKYELDVYIPSLALAIEPGSWFWHKRKISRDNEKRVLCKHKGIRLITVYSDYEEDSAPFGFDCIILSETLGQDKDYEATKKLINELLVLCGVEVQIPEKDWKEITNRAYINSRRISTAIFINRLVEIQPDIEVLGEYRGALNAIICKCKKCGNQWTSTPHNLLSGHGCLKCAAKERARYYRKKPADFEKEIAIISPNIQLLSQYITSNDPVRCKCKLCGNEWSVLPYSLKKGSGCKKCGKTTQYAKNTT